MKVTTDGCLFGAWVAREVKSREHRTNNMLDIGVGTGLLTLMVAQKNPALVIDGIEIDRNAFLQAKENVLNAPFANKIYLQHEDVLKENTGRKYDVIVSNPPFYENEIPSVNRQRNMAHHGEGLLLNELLQIIKSKITADSNFYLLLPYKRRNELETLFRKHHLQLVKMVSVKQTPGHDYFRLLICGALYTDSPVEESDMSITDEAGNYTAGFIQLLKEYYLYL